MINDKDIELVTTICNLIYGEFNLDENIITSNRDRDIVDAKNLIVFMLRKMTNLSFREITIHTPIINRKISANRHGYHVMANLIKDSKSFRKKLNTINKTISLTPKISNKFKDRYFEKKKEEYVDAYVTNLGNYMILLPSGNEYICLDCPEKKEIIGKKISIQEHNIKKMKYKIEFSPLNGNYFFDEYIRYNKLNNYEY